MSATAKEKVTNTADNKENLPLQSPEEKRDILESFFQKKIWGQQEHEFAPVSYTHLTLPTKA